MSKKNKREKQADQRRAWQRRRERVESDAEERVIFKGQAKDDEMEFQVLETVRKDGTKSIEYCFGPITVPSALACPSMVEVFKASQAAKDRGLQ